MLLHCIVNIFIKYFMLFITHRQLFLGLALLKPYETLVHSKKQKSPTHAKESTETRRQICAKYTAGRGRGKGREEAEKVWLVFFFLAFFSRHWQWQNVRNAFDNFIQFQTYFSKLFGCQRGGEPCPARL